MADLPGLSSGGYWENPEQTNARLGISPMSDVQRKALDDYTANLDQQINNDSFNQKIQQLNQQQNENQQQGLNYYSNIKPGTYEYNYFAATDKQRGLPEGTSLREVINYYRNQQPNIATPLLDQSTQVANPSAQLTTNYSFDTQRNVQKSMPSNYTGYIGSTPYLEGKAQTSGGGYYTDPNTGKVVYSAGYRGGGGGWYEDRGQWGTGMNMGPIVNGTVQTGGGGFTPDGSYSAGYHGSGEHPEITGESTPGDFKSGSFGPVAKPDFSNGIKVEKYLRYLQGLGYNVDKYFNGNEGLRLRQGLEAEYNRNGGYYDSEKLVRTLTNPNPKKTDLLFSVNAQTPLKDIQSILGANFEKLYQTPEQYNKYLNTQLGINQAGTTTANTLRDIAPAIENTYVNPYTGQTTDLLEDYYKPTFSYYSLGMGKSRAKK
jgi:hypothetical protein